MKIQEILNRFPELKLKSGSAEEEIDYIQSDSRKIIEGHGFIAYNEFGENASKYAEASGAEIVLVDESSDNWADFNDKTILTTPGNPRFWHGKIASFMKGNPTEALQLVAVTGTNGKTSLTTILFNLALDQGLQAGLIGTVCVRYGDTILDTGYTTPDPSSLQSLLAEMRDQGIQIVFIEASSIGLALARMDGCKIRAAVFTNLTKDHLDFHKDMQEYLESKFILFRYLQESEIWKERFGLISYDSPGGIDLWKLSEVHNLAPLLDRLGSGCDLEIKNEYLSLEKTEYELQDNRTGNCFSIQTNLLGGFSVVNTALAFGTGLRLGFDPNKMLSSLKSIPLVPGRFQIIKNKSQDRVAVVDYAHTPDALKNILQSIHSSNPKRVITLFGCGGDRDRTKRPEMARIAEQYSDFVIVTSDNPRTEDPGAILDEICTGFSSGFEDYLREADRRTAIQTGVNMLGEGDFLLVAGKGHEDYQILGKTKIHFSDTEELQKAFENRESVRKL